MILSPKDMQTHVAISEYANQSPHHKAVLTDCLNTFSIFSQDTRKELDNYFLLYWEPSYFLECLTGDDKNTIIRNGIPYIVIYQELLSPEYINIYKRIRLSFRRITGVPNGFVLVRSFREKEVS